MNCSRRARIVAVGVVSLGMGLAVVNVSNTRSVWAQDGDGVEGKQSMKEQGAVKSFLKNEHEDVEGLLLDSGVRVHFPPHIAKKIVEKVKLILDVGALMGSLVGQSEQRTRQALQIVDAMGPCILMIDEVEKALPGVSGSDQNDGGVASTASPYLSWWDGAPGPSVTSSPPSTSLPSSTSLSCPLTTLAARRAIFDILPLEYVEPPTDPGDP